MEDLRRLTEIVKNARKSCASLVEELADEYVVYFASGLKSELKYCPEKSENNWFSYSIEWVSLGKRELHIGVGIYSYKGEDISEHSYIRASEWEGTLFDDKKCNVERIRPFIEALEKRGFVVCVNPGDNGVELYPFFRV